MINLDDLLQDKRLVVERTATRLCVYIYRANDDRQLYFGDYSGSTDDISTFAGIELACSQLAALMLRAGERAYFSENKERTMAASAPVTEKRIS